MADSHADIHKQQTASDALATVDYISSLLTASEFDLGQLLQEVVRSSAEKMGLKASAVRLLDRETGELVARAAYGLSDWFLAQGPRYGIKSRFQRLITSEGVLQVKDIEQESDPQFRDIARHEGIRSFLAIGLYTDGEMIGALSVYGSEAQPFTPTEVDSFRLIAKQVSLAITLARLHEVRAEKERLDRDLEVASEIQLRALPSEPIDVPGFRIACRYVPFGQVGGDFYDFIQLPLGNLGIVVGDVSGKGIQAALLSLSTRTAIRAHAEYEYSIGEIIARANRTICQDTEPEQFATLFYGVLNVVDRRLTYVTALCPAPVVIRQDDVATLDTGGLPVGILSNQEYEQDVLHIESGDLIVMYSDGYSEVFNKEGDMFGDERVRDCVRENSHLGPDEIIDRLEAELEGFLDGSDHGDDRTIVVVRAE